MRGLARRQPAREGSAYGTGNGGGYFTDHHNGAVHTGVSWLSLCPYSCLQQHPFLLVGPSRSGETPPEEMKSWQHPD